ncbi:enoyl-CoA hydratase/carnithine racemase [Nocardioides daedukensis]|uniref:Enoyl-CoA hydratase/carnithine racemase n=1 Tax=Nocardioides daedukensis TaxID=634462 RepID=A0A7Y9RZ20_9ACTN|nr:crotonase/enoyl-CoA hydratase family protein [Nocardioides daedukensis]NYG59286.1 enoyl-CoA hydratase/carnithine racemase [Nocardioides daedukensis]
MTQSEQRVTIEVADGIADVVLNRPDKMNALDGAMIDQINAAIEEIAGRDDVRVVVLSGAGRAFCAGIDLAYLGDPNNLGDLSERTHGEANRFQQVAWGWRTLEVPVVAALHGVVFGGGLQIALGADIRIAHPSAKLAVMEAKWGLVPDMAGYPLLRENLRGDVARELVYTGRQVDGSEAAQIGLVTRTHEDPRAEAMRVAKEISESSAAALAAAKRIFALSSEQLAPAGEVLLAESREQQVLLSSDEPRRRLSQAARPAR